jgi:branched-chain amino acid transport system permease protein
VITLEGFLINLLNGLSFGAVLFLLAAGLSLILGLMGVLNLAHGALFLFGAYVGVSLVREGMHFLLAALGGGLSAAFIGFLKERFFLRHLHGYILEQVLISFGFVYILTNLATWIWGTSPRLSRPRSRDPFRSGNSPSGVSIADDLYRHGHWPVCL